MKVQFVRKFKNVSEYDVDGKRVWIQPGVEFPSYTPAEFEAIKMWVLDEYAKYLNWRHTVPEIAATVPVQPITNLKEWEVFQ